MICSHSSASPQVAWAFAKRLGTGAAGVPNTNEPDDIACAEASRKMFEAWSEAAWKSISELDYLGIL